MTATMKPKSLIERLPAEEIDRLQGDLAAALLRDYRPETLAALIAADMRDHAFGATRSYWDAAVDGLRGYLDRIEGARG